MRHLDFLWPLGAVACILFLGWIDSRRITRRTRANSDIDTLARHRVGYGDES